MVICNIFQTQNVSVLPRCVVLFVECCESSGCWQAIHDITSLVVLKRYFDRIVILVKMIFVTSFLNRYPSKSLIATIFFYKRRRCPQIRMSWLFFPIVILPIHSLCHKLCCPIKPYSNHLQRVEFKITCKRLKQTYHY